ncbi:MAG: hypothetical protein ACM3S2_03880 [Ignavibacteriales bacterium]
MLKRLLLLFSFLFVFVLPVALFAQESDSTDTWDNWDNEDDYECSDTPNFDFMDFHMHGKPTIEATYGNSKLGIKSFTRGFSNVGAAELKLSYSRLSEYEGYIVKYRNNFAYISNSTTDLISKTGAVNDISSNLWRFGFGSQEGYGYKFGNSAIIPYTSNSFGWSRVEWNLPGAATTGPLLYTPDEMNTLSLYDKTFRFGTMSEGGIKLQIVPLLTFNAGYERSIVFPRHLFWKHLGSMAVEWIGIGAVDFFSREVMDSSPAAGPIINFLLKNGLSYAIYQLRREKMNWPFDSAEPLSYDTWKVGMTFTF